MGSVPHLHVASGYSARYGASHPHDLVARAAERGIAALALTDRDTVTGTVRFAKAAEAAGVTPLFGVELGTAGHAPAPAVRRPAPACGGAHVPQAPFRATLLARNGRGWARLCRTVSAAHADAFAAGTPVAASWKVLTEHIGEDLMVLLGPASEPLRALAAGRPDTAERLLTPWRAAAGAGLRLEIVCWGLPGTGPGSVRLAAATLALADRLSIPAVLTNAVRYADPAQHRSADVLDAARLLRPIDRRSLDCGERWLKDDAGMLTLAERVAAAAGGGAGRAQRLIADTIAVADACTADPVELGLGTPHFPEPEVVGAAPGPGGAMRLLRQRCESGMTARGLDLDRRAMQQLDYELAIIGRLGYEPYFLAVAQVVADVRDMGIRVAARGSGAGSMVNHALFVAAANPLGPPLKLDVLGVRMQSAMAHAVAFAVPALQSAYLKAHHPAALYAGLLEHDPGMWAPRVIVADARRHNVPVLPVDINASRPTYTVEQTPTGWGVRISLASVHGISHDEIDRIAQHQPYTSLQDLHTRAHPKLPVLHKLIRIGALDHLKGHATRRDLLLQATELHRQARTRPATGQLPLDSTRVAADPSGLKEMTAREQLEAELGVLKMDVSRHLMDDHHRLLREIGATDAATDAAHLRAMHPGQRVLVAGVRASTQTPPIASGRRIIFVTLEDGSGLVDVAFFDDTHEACAHTIFHNGLLLVRGTVEARGPRRTVVGEMAWDLDTLAATRRTHGPQAALDLLGQAPAPTPPQPNRTFPDGTAGARLHPFSDRSGRVPEFPEGTEQELAGPSRS